MNEQTLWTLMSIRETSGTPIAGWPESKVRMICQNKSRGLTGANPQYHFPLQTYSLKPFVAEMLLPLIYPLLLSFGFMAIGWPGVGKTPAIIVMALAMGRYNIRKAGLEPAEEQSIIEEPSSAAPVPEPEHQPEENEANSIGDEMDVVDGETVPDEEAVRFLRE
eukprot:s4620_g2.t1